MIPTANDLVHDSIAFAENMLMVQDKARKLVPLRLNRAQRHYLANKTRRDLILKARQIGFSTAIQAEMFRLYTTKAESVLTMADKQDNTDKLRRMAERYYDKLPPNFTPPIRSEANASMTVYPVIGSEVQIATAGSQTSGRASTYTKFHGSEVAYWRNADWVIAGALQAIPEHLDNTWVVFESTANGASGWFFDECNAALKGDSEWTLHFYAWWWDIDYKIPLLKDEQIIYNNEEFALVEKHNLSPEQIKWRRKKQRDLKDMFQQEHPESPMQAFLTTGGSVYTITQDMLYMPQETSAIKTDKEKGIKGHTYAMGVDWGQDVDSTTVSIIDATDYREVMIWHTRRRDDDAILDDIVNFAKQWNVTLIRPEENGMGKQYVRRLENMIGQQQWDDVYPIVDKFNMTQRSKDKLVKMLKIGLGEGLLLVDDDYANAELRIFKTTKKSSSGVYSYGHPSGKHDDTVIARLLAHEASYRLKEY